MTLDPKWLAILKASGWQLTMLAIACAVLLLLMILGVIDIRPWPWVLIVMSVALAVTTALALASIGEATTALFPVHTWLQRRIAIRAAKRRAADYIPYMTARERQIIGYLLRYNQKSFDAAVDFGYAATLVGRGIVMPIVPPGHAYDPEHVPTTVPDHVWDVLVEHREKFPHQPEMDGHTEVHPWRVPYMLR